MTIVVIDQSVFTHSLERRSDYEGKPDNVAKGIKDAQVAWLLSCQWLDGYVDPAECYPLIVRDTKPYWRSEYLLQPEVYERIKRYGKRKDKKTGKRVELKAKPVHYKAGRRLSSDLYKSIVSRATRTIDNSGVPCLQATGYEADDFAAAIVKFNAELAEPFQQDILLVTVDSDWLGLVSEKVGWYCMTGHAPRVRDNMASINSWVARRLKTTIKTPRDIWTVKAEQGDKSDNLPPGSPIEVIDLLAPPEQYDLLNIGDTRKKLQTALAMRWQQNPTLSVSARDYLRLTAVRPFPSLFDPTKDVFYAA